MSTHQFSRIYAVDVIDYVFCCALFGYHVDSFLQFKFCLHKDDVLFCTASIKERDGQSLNLSRENNQDFIFVAMPDSDCLSHLMRFLCGTLNRTTQQVDRAHESQ